MKKEWMIIRRKALNFVDLIFMFMNVNNMRTYFFLLLSFLALLWPLPSVFDTL